MLASRIPLALVLTAFVAGTAVVPGNAAFAQQGAESKDTLDQFYKITRGDLVARRDSALDVLVQLDAETAKKFRSLTNAYDADLKKIVDQRIALMKDFQQVYDRLTPESAKQMADRAFRIEEERNALRRKYFDRMTAEISPVAAVQFLQLQHQFETMADLKAATLAPLATR